MFVLWVLNFHPLKGFFKSLNIEHSVDNLLYQKLPKAVLGKETLFKGVRRGRSSLKKMCGWSFVFQTLTTFLCKQLRFIWNVNTKSCFYFENRPLHDT